MIFMPGPQPEYTLAQADDLAKHFLGPEWFARESAHEGRSSYELHVGKPNVHWSRSVAAHAGESWREAFRRAGVKLPYRPRFANVGKRVLVGSEELAICHSNKWAERIAVLLNKSEAA